MKAEPLKEALDRFSQLEDIERRRETASEFMKNSLAVAARTGEAKLEELCASTEVREPILEFARSYERDREDLAFLKSQQDLVDAEDLESKTRQLDERSSDPRLRFAARFLGYSSLNNASDETVETTEPERSDNEPPMDLTFFERPPEVVAEDMKGLTISVKGNSAVITETFPQDEKYNEKWASDPIFGDNRVDVMVSKYRGHKILYIKAGDANHSLDCVRINGIEIDGKKIKSANQICEALGLDEEVVGDLRFDGKKIKIVNLKPLKNKKTS